MGKNQISRAQCRVKSGTPADLRDPNAEAEANSTSRTGKTQATPAVAENEIPFSKAARMGGAVTGVDVGEEDSETQQSVPPQSQHVQIAVCGPAEGAGPEMAA